jgi:NAD+ kinase
VRLQHLPRPKYVVVVAKEGHPLAHRVAKQVAGQLLRAGISVATIAPLRLVDRPALPSLEGTRRKRPELVAVVGGDGTLLRTFRGLRDATPVLGVNVGGRGILAEVRPEQVPEAVTQITSGRALLEPRLRLSARRDGTRFPPATNEVYLSRVPKTRTPTFHIRLEPGIRLTERMDGFLVATPTGSTGHAYSLGGPVVYEGLDTMVLAPLASLTRFPCLVLPVTPLVARADQPLNVVIDGQEVFNVAADQPVRIERYPHPAMFVRLAPQGLRQLKNLGFR